MDKTSGLTLLFPHNGEREGTEAVGIQTGLVVAEEMGGGDSVEAWHVCGRSPRVAGRIYGWFTEGFDTPDLIDAKALFDELS